MLFNTRLFLIFFVVVMILYRALRNYRWQNAMLLIASYLFYSAWDWRFLSLLLGSTLVDYISARRIHQTQSKARRRFYLTLSLACNLGALGFFKYYNFGVESFNQLLKVFNLTAHLPTLQIILPVGISFYTFQTISYTVDVYRGQREPTTNLLDFALYVAYFPQLVAGPIEKSTHLLPQLQRRRVVTLEDYRVGVMWMLLGYFKKVVIADTVAPMVNDVFANPNEVSGVISLVAILGFAVQIYGDFAGYTLIARGVSRLMGIHLTQNFNAPYLSRNPREFWTRWHISLSSWLREYLYFSLGGSRKGQRRTYVNLMTTMLLGGLWHGARWNFVIWGAYHGISLVICHAFGVSKKKTLTSPVVVFFQIAGTFALTLVGWLLFRVTSMQHLYAIVSNIFTNFHLTEDLAAYLKPTLPAFALLMAYHIWQEYAKDDLVLLHWNQWFRVGVYAFILVALLVVGFSPIQFVYFQF